MSSHIALMPRLSDTDADALRVTTALYRDMTPAEKLERVRALTLSASTLTLAGLRERHPTETEPHLLMRLARLRLGDELAERAYPKRADR